MLARETALTAIGVDGGIIATACAVGPIDAPVPGCPDWDLADLVVHTGRIHRWATATVRSGGDLPAAFPARPEGDLPGWFADGVAELLRALEETAPGAPVWTLVGPGTASFWATRQAVETAVHRVDAERVIGRATPIAREVALAGLEEVLTVLAPRLVGRGAVPGEGETLHLHATDGDGEFLVRLLPDRLEVTREHAKGDAAVRGSASDLLLWLHNREPLGEIEIFGDTAVAARWHEQFHL